MFLETGRRWKTLSYAPHTPAFYSARGKLALPRHWIHAEDRILFAEYYRAQLVKQFGDIPEVHTVANMDS